MKYTAADRRWSKVVKERDRYTCQRCHKVYPEGHRGIHAAHIFSRGIKRLRHDLRNGMALCYGCHRYLDTHPNEKEEFFAKVLDDYEGLYREAHDPKGTRIPKEA